MWVAGAMCIKCEFPWNWFARLLQSYHRMVQFQSCKEADFAENREGGVVAKETYSSSRDTVTLRYLKHQLKPADILDFISLKCFERAWTKLKLDLDDLKALRVFITANPKCGKVIPGTKRLRKLRFAPLRWNVGKSGGARVLYVYFESFGIVLLAMIYRKGDMGNISSAVKAQLNRLIEEQERELRRRNTL
jgi:hypothetical protein